MNIVLVGPGRAGLGLSLRLLECGHTIAGVLARDPEAASSAADRLRSSALAWDADLPAADLIVLAVRDDAIAEVAGRVAPHAAAASGAVHLSGVGPVSLLAPLADAGLPVGSFHPLQTLPTPETGAARLDGAWVGITSDDDLFADRLFALAATMGMRPFELADDAKPLYHAAAAAAANYTLAALGLSERLFEAAGVPFEAAEPLVEAVIRNAFEMGAGEALTGPISRGDVGTVSRQVSAVRDLDPALGEDFAALGRVAARMAGTEGQMRDALGDG
jgi:predicted short-subunit dehydrogenase-like oxidoreductase (DUF2520 family)